MEPGRDTEKVQNPSGPQQRRNKPQTITWLCVPYFSLDKYTAKGSGSGQGVQPVRTLLHGHSSSVFEDRDMHQAVCKLAGGKPDFCYYVPQVWYLVIGDCECFMTTEGMSLTRTAMLISCARVPIRALQANDILVTPTPSPSPSSTEGQKVLVNYGVSLLWSFTFNDCQTWFVRRLPSVCQRRSLAYNLVRA